MAKWGEGDPRWIVEERPDATNVNNWHWTEKNADAWSKKKLKELLVGLEVTEGPARVRVEEMERCEGEARANNRKAKLIFFYEWELVLKWKGSAAGGEEEVAGKITVPNLSEEHTDMADVDLEVTLTDGAKARGAQQLKELMRRGAGAAMVRRQFEKYVESLKSEFGQGLILPAAEAAAKNSSVTAKKDPTASTSSSSKSTSSTSPATKQSTAKDATKALSEMGLGLESIKLKERFKCTGQELYNVFTQKEMMQVWTRGSVKMEGDASAGTDFELLGGNVTGRFLEVKPFTLVKQKWRLSSWPDGHFSEVGEE